MIKAILVFLIIFLIVRAFIITGLESGQRSAPPEEKKHQPGKAKKGVPKELGEYVEYEEVDRQN
jgi:flagellar biosynthesis/type III secretory pathway M-ring protein FliF/YscJ